MLTVVIPVYNAAAMLGDCLSALARQSDPGVPWEVIVVDNGSTDLSREIAAGFDVRVVTEERRGAYAARNRGIAEARFPFVAFTDADCIPLAGWVAGLAAALEGETVLGGPILSYPPTTPAERYLCDLQMVSQERAFKGDLFRLPFFVTANACYPKALLERVGGFDATLLIAGDADLAWRSRDAGGRLRFVPEAALFHHHRGSARLIYNQHYQYGFGWVELLAKHRDRFTPEVAWVMAPLRDDLWRDVWRGIRPGTRDRRRCWYDVLAKLGHLNGSREACRQLGLPALEGMIPLEPRPDQPAAPGKALEEVRSYPQELPAETPHEHPPAPRDEIR